MNDARRTDRIDETKRRLVKSSVLTGAALATGRVPYASPRVKSFFGDSAFAGVTPVYTISCSAIPTEVGSSGGICDDANLVNIVAMVSPIPPIGTQLRCNATSDDPQNPSVAPGTQATDAQGEVQFFSVSLGLFGNPPIAAGSTVTLRTTFVDPFTFGNAECVQTWVVEACG